MNIRKHTPKLVIAGLAVTIACSVFGRDTTGSSTTPTVDEAAVLVAVDNFTSTLTSDQKSTVQVDFTSTNAAKWSNLPGADRNGLEFKNLTADQLAAALNLAKVALSADGYERLQEIRTADDYLGEYSGTSTTGTTTGGTTGTTTGGGPGGGPGTTGGTTGTTTGGTTSGGTGGGTGGGATYSAGNYYVAFVGTPSSNAPWILQFGGHHLAFNIAYNGAKVATTPYFVGVEPRTFTTDSATTTGLSGTYAPMDTKRNAMYNLLNSLSTDQLATAKLSTSFSDVYLGPGQDSKSDYPAQQGIAYTALTSAQQALVRTAISTWTTDGTAGTAFYNTYVRGLSSTKVAWSGSDTTLNTQGDYVRIDGPRCWMEFVCQNGVVFSSQIHFHSVWRDKTSDYGSDFTF